MTGGPLCDHVHEIANARLQVRDCWLEDSWKIDYLAELVGESGAEEVVSTIEEQKEGADLLI
ncbi:unnamed protein product [Ilex paraguariensis]|uniref:Uncharacterized protein n=1 Tax=Ilex paraguariensis TaxID=185542 RepID=A0ABC8SHJ4_9AQUA